MTLIHSILTRVLLQRSGIPVALTSRLLSKSNFETTASQKELVSALTAANDATGSVILLFSTPASYPGDDATSVTDAWRDSLTHVTLVTTWNWNATKAEKEGQYTLASSAIDHLRKITPDAAYVVRGFFRVVSLVAYCISQNEADVYEPNHEGVLGYTLCDMRFQFHHLLSDVLGYTLRQAVGYQAEVVRIFRHVDYYLSCAHSVIPINYSIVGTVVCVSVLASLVFHLTFSFAVGWKPASSLYQCYLPRD